MFYYLLLLLSHGSRDKNNEVTGNVHHLQRMMFTSTFKETIIVQIFFAFKHYCSNIFWPLFIVLLVTTFPIPYGSYCCWILFTKMSFQSTIRTIAQRYFIWPFRDATKKFLFLKNIFNTTTVVSEYNTRSFKVQGD